VKQLSATTVAAMVVMIRPEILEEYMVGFGRRFSLEERIEMLWCEWMIF
jgi:hypothetical protein